MVKIIDRVVIELTDAEVEELERLGEQDAEDRKNMPPTSEDYEAALNRLGVET